MKRVRVAVVDLPSRRTYAVATYLGQTCVLVNQNLPRRTRRRVVRKTLRTVAQ